MGKGIESTILDGNIEKKSLYGNEEEYEPEGNSNREELKSALHRLESLETDSYSALGAVEEDVEPIFDGTSLGRATINVPIEQRQSARIEEPQLSSEQIAEIEADSEKINKEFKGKAEAMIDELGDFF